MWPTEQLSLDEIVARNRGDADWRDNAPLSSEGSYRRKSMEAERPSKYEPEPNIDKFRYASMH
jgi:hypothetical protein